MTEFKRGQVWRCIHPDVGTTVGNEYTVVHADGQNRGWFEDNNHRFSFIEEDKYRLVSEPMTLEQAAEELALCVDYDKQAIRMDGTLYYKKEYTLERIKQWAVMDMLIHKWLLEDEEIPF